MKPPGISRREFTQTTLAAGAALASFSVAQTDEPKRKNKTIGIQIGAASFVDEGVDKVLDFLQERGAINTIFLTTFTYGRGLAGRQIPGQPFPDHGPQETDEKFYHGGNYARPHPEFYGNTSLTETRAPDHGDIDILETVLPAAKKRGLKVICSCEDVWNRSVPNVEPTLEIDLKGRKAGTQCLLSPDVRNFWTALVTDYCKSYPVDGVLFFNERNGPLLNALGASHAQSIASGRVTCFCPLHQEAARQRGLDFKRVREGYQKLDAFIQASLAGHRPTDGYFVEFWRLLVEYPEIVAWDRLFDEGKHQVLASIYSTVKGINKDLQVGFHIEHVNSFNPIFRATRSYADLAEKTDFLKIVVYNNCGGERYRHFIENIASTVFRDVPKDELLQFNNHLLNYANEKPLDELPKAGLSPDYVFRETKRALDGVQGKCRIYPGIDIGIPTGKNSRKASPDDTYQATLAGLKSGANGLILSRKYSEMRLDNIAAAGRAVRDFWRMNKGLFYLGAASLCSALCPLHATEWERHAFPLSESIWSVEAADLNRDGRLDLVAMGETKVFVLSAPDWEEHLFFDTKEPKMLYCVALDMNGDQHPDIAVSRYRVPWIEYREALKAGKQADKPPGPEFSIGWLENTGKLDSPAPLHVLDRELNGTHGLTVGDVNGDGVKDLIADSIVGPAFPNSILWFQVPSGERHIVAKNGADGRPHYLDFADINADGRGDILLGDSQGGTFTWWEQQQDHTWLKHLIAKKPGATNIRPGDMNHDGKLDVVGSCDHGKGVFWFEAPGWQEHVIDAEVSSPHALAVADFDGDGDLDVAIASFTDFVVRWYENNGHGEFTPHEIDTGHRQQAYDLKAVDLDGDGRMDLILAGRESRNAVWYRNVR